MTVTVEEKCLRIKEAAAFLGVRPGTIFKWMRVEPTFPRGAKVGKLRIFLKSDLVAFLARKQRKGGK